MKRLMMIAAILGLAQLSWASDTDASATADRLERRPKDGAL